MSTAGENAAQAKFDSKAVLKDLDERGYAVVPNVLTLPECDKYTGEYKAWLDQFDKAGIPLVSRSSCIQSYRVAHFSTTWEVRLKTKPVFEQLWKTGKLLTSADGVAISKPPEWGSEEYAMPDENWLHLDQEVRRQGLHAYQGAVYLEETTETDHCFRVLSHSHLYHTEFFQKFPKADQSSRKLEFYKLNKTQRKWYHERSCELSKVPAPKGGMILWDSRTVHDNCKPVYGRPHNDRWRFVIFVSMTPAFWATPEDLTRKNEAYEKLLITTHWSSQGIKTFKPYGTKKEPSVTITAQPDVARTKEACLLFGLESYNYEDGEPNGPPAPTWAS